MHRLGAGLGDRGEQPFVGEVRLGQRRRTESERDVGLLDVCGTRIGVAVDGHGLVPEPVGRSG